MGAAALAHGEVDAEDDAPGLAPPAERSRLQSAILTLTSHSTDRWYLATDLWDYVPEQAEP